MEDLANRSLLPCACSVTDLDRVLPDRNLLVLYNIETKECQWSYICICPPIDHKYEPIKMQE